MPLQKFAQYWKQRDRSVVDFGIGAIFDCFHVTGKHPVEID